MRSAGQRTECTLMRRYPERTITLDLHRLKEGVETHFQGDATRMLSLNRSLLPLETVDQISHLREHVDQELNSESVEIVGRLDRFYEPAQSGYCDFKFLVRDPDTEFISMVRAVHTEFELSTFFPSLNDFWAERMILSERLMDELGVNPPAVIVADNYLKDDDNSCLIVTGFPDRNFASIYAELRMLNSLSQLRKISSSVDHWRFNWMTLGEDLGVFGEDGMQTFLGPNITPLMLSMSLTQPRSYVELEAELNLEKISLDLGN